MIADPLVLGLTEADKRLRKGYVCSSDAGDIMAGRWNEKYKVKRGLIDDPDLYDKLSPVLDYHVLKHFTRERLELTSLIGHATEPLNAFWYERMTGRAVERRGEWVIGEGAYAFMGGHLDGVSTTSRGQPCYWDAKWTGRADEAFILRHTPQGVHNATILGCDWWGLSVFIGNGKWEWIEQEIDPLYQARLIAAEREFWTFVERGEEPEDRAEPKPPPKPQPKRREIALPYRDPRLSIRVIHDNGHMTYLGPCPECDELRAMWAKEDADLPNWSGDFMRLARDFAGTHDAAVRHAITREEIKALVPDDVGKVTFGLVRYGRDGRGQIIALDKPEEDDDGNAAS